MPHAHSRPGRQGCLDIFTYYTTSLHFFFSRPPFSLAVSKSVLVVSKAIQPAGCRLRRICDGMRLHAYMYTANDLCMSVYICMGLSVCNACTDCTEAVSFMIQMWRASDHRRLSRMLVLSLRRASDLSSATSPPIIIADAHRWFFLIVRSAVF